MDCLGATLPACFDDPFDIEVALGRGCRPDADRFVGHPYMQSLGVGIGINCQRRDPHPMRSPDDAAGDLAAIGNQDLTEHEVRVGVRDCFALLAMTVRREPSLRESQRRSNPDEMNGNLLTGGCCRAFSADWRAACPAALRAPGTAAAGFRAVG